MIEYITGDIIKAPVQALVNPVNCVGVMGAGLALKFKYQFPGMFECYKLVCQANRLQPGKLFIYRTKLNEHHEYILCFPTKVHWRNKSQLDWIEQGLIDLKKELSYRQIKSIALPYLGCGLGGLDKSSVKTLIEQNFTLEGIKVYVYEQGS